MSQHLASIRQSVGHRAILGAAVAFTLLGSKAAFADVPPLSYVQGNSSSSGNPAVAKLLADAQVALNGGNIRLALIDLKNAVSSAPRNSAARTQLGLVLLRAGDTPSAERELRQARQDGALDTVVLPILFQAMLARHESQMLLDQFPSPSSNAGASADILKARAMAFQDLGRTAEAVNAMDRSLQLRRDAPGLLSRARLSAQQGNLTAAKSFIDEAIQRSPGEPDAMILKVQLLMVSNDNSAALELANQLVSKFPSSLLGRFERVEVLLRIKQDIKAKAEIDAILDKNPSNLMGIYYKALLIARAGDAKAAWGIAQTLPSEFSDAEPGMAVMISRMAQNGGSEETAAAILNRVLLNHPDRVAVRIQLASLRLKQNSPEAAFSVLEPMKDSSDPRLVGLLTQIYLRLHRDSDALATLSRLNGSGGTNDAVKREIALLDMQMGHPDQAVEVLAQAVSKEPTNPNLAAPYINALLQLHRLPEALAVADKLGSNANQRASALILRGSILVIQHNAAGAQAAFDKAIQIEPKNTAALYSRAGLFESTQKYAEAGRDLRAILSIDPKNITAFLKLAEIAARQGEDQNVRGILAQAISVLPENPSPRIALVRYLASRRDIDGALRAVNGLLSSQPNNSDGVALLGELQQVQGKKKEAVTTFRRLVVLAPSAASAQLRLGNALIAIGDSASAALAFNAAVKISPNAPDVRAAQINFQLSQGKVDEAVATARSFQAFNAGSDADLLLADTLLKAKRPDQAEAVLRKSLTDKPSSQMLLNLARVAILSNDKKRAEDIMANWLVSNPNDTGVRFEYATLLMQEENNAKAIAQYQMVLKNDQNNVAAMNNLGWLLQNSDPKRALLILTAASKLSPDSADVADTLGWIKIQQKDIVGGLALLNHAHSLHPQDGEITYHLVAGLNAGANHEAARGLLRALLASGAKFKDQPAAVQLSVAWQ